VLSGFNVSPWRTSPPALSARQGIALEHPSGGGGKTAVLVRERREPTQPQVFKHFIIFFFVFSGLGLEPKVSHC
jgi:hypothetical protein